MQFPTDPKVIGPGVWYMLTVSAYKAQTPELIKAWIDFFYTAQENFTCGDCKEHWGDFIRKNPPTQNIYTDFKYNGKLLGMLYYIVEFHNAVNIRLGKPTYTFSQVIKSFETNDLGYCAEGCADHTDHVNNANHTTQTNNSRPKSTASYVQHPRMVPTSGSIVPILSSKGNLVKCMNNYCKA